MLEQTNDVILIRITRSFVSFALFRNVRDRYSHRTTKLWPYKYMLYVWNPHTIPKHSFLVTKAKGNNVMFPSLSNISPSPVYV